MLNLSRLFGRLCGVLTGFAASVLAIHGAVNPADWRFTQSVEVPAPGLVKVPLPAATLGALRPAAADLRLLDPAGEEVGWFLERPLQFTPASPVRAPKSFRVALQPPATVLTIETGVDQPIAGVVLAAGDSSFLKAARVEGSLDGRTWQPVASGLPVYQNYQGETRRQLALPPGVWPWLRVTLDDSRTRPVPVSGVQLQISESGVPPALNTAPARVVAREELPGETRLRLDLGAANLDLAFLELASPEGYFTRRGSLRVRGLERGEWSERVLVRGLLHREPLPDGAPGPAARLEVNGSVPAREAILAIENGDSPPLPVTAVTVASAPVELVFWARAAGRFQLLAGNGECPAPRYDLAAFAEQFRTARPQRAAFGELVANPGFRPPAVAPDPFALGAALDVAAWAYQKPLPITQAGAQELDLDLDVMSRARPGLGDLRLVSDGQQRPFILEPAAAMRTLVIEPSPANDPKQPAVSRWKLPLSRAGLPLATLKLESSTPLFERDVVVHEEVPDERGANVRRILGEARWRRMPGEAVRPLVLELRNRPATAAPWLEIRNGDNSPLALGAVTAGYPVARVHFLAPVTPATALFYGNPAATAPVYDLQLIAPRLLEAEGARVTAGPEEPNRSHRREREWMLAGRGVWLFWAALAVVVVALLLVLRRLLPAA